MINETDSPPDWMKPAGIAALVVALLAFAASAVQGGGGTMEGGLVAGLLNPLFFVGLPLGIYWLNRHAVLADRKRHSANASATRVRFKTDVHPQSATQSVGESPQTPTAFTAPSEAQSMPTESGEPVGELGSIRCRLDQLEAENAQLKRQLQESSPTAKQPENAQGAPHEPSVSALNWSSKPNSPHPSQDPPVNWLLVALVVVLVLAVPTIVLIMSHNRRLMRLGPTILKIRSTKEPFLTLPSKRANHIKTIAPQAPSKPSRNRRPIGNAGNYAAAIKLFSLALDEGYLREFALANRAVARLKIDDRKNAIKDLESALEFGSLSGDAYFTLGYALYLEGEYDRARHYSAIATRLHEDKRREDKRRHDYLDAINRQKQKRESPTGGAKQ